MPAFRPEIRRHVSTTLGVLAFDKDTFVDPIPQPVLTGFAKFPGQVALSSAARSSGDMGLFVQASGNPFAAFAEDLGSVRFYFVFGVTEPETRALLEQAIKDGKFQMRVLTRKQGEAQAIGLRKSFGEPLRLTEEWAPRCFTDWLKDVALVTPELPRLFADRLPAKPLGSIRHCSVIMVPPSQLGEISRQAALQRPPVDWS